MLGITDNAIHDHENLAELESEKLAKLPGIHIRFRKLLLILLVIFLVFLFLPWTQTVHSSGAVTTLRPEHRPQTIHATIAGRIEKWYVAEGQAVKQGDTIVHLSEVKAEYMDSRLVERVGNQVDAKEGAIQSYSGKVGALDTQISAMQRELESKLQQVQNKIRQAELKIESDQAGIEQAEVDVQIATRQLDGVKTLYDKGLKSLTELEAKRLKLQECESKLVSARNKLASSRNDLNIYKAELTLTRNEYSNKIAKAQSDKFSTLSDQFDATASVNKLRIERENYTRRASFYYVIAPQDGYIVKAIKPGIGEILKEGDPVVSILPTTHQLAAELYIQPMDLPLVHTGHKIRLQFDGWPAVFFSGWPGVSTGTFGGEVVVVDRVISSNGKFRLLVAPDPLEAPWPSAIQVGGGVTGVALLNNVPVWYEGWRILNGFPPDLYLPKSATDKNTPPGKAGK